VKNVKFHEKFWDFLFPYIYDDISLKINEIFLQTNFSKFKGTNCLNGKFNSFFNTDPNGHYMIFFYNESTTIKNKMSTIQRNLHHMYLLSDILD